MRTVGWVDPAAEVKKTELEQAEEPAPVLSGVFSRYFAAVRAYRHIRLATAT